MIRNLRMVFLMAGILCLLVAPVGADILYWDFETPPFAIGPVDGQQGWVADQDGYGYVVDNTMYGGGHVVAGEQSLLQYFGHNTGSDYTLNNSGFSETGTTFSFLAADKGVDAVDMHVYIVENPPVNNIWCRIFMTASWEIAVLSGQITGIGGAPPTHPREEKILGVCQQGDTYSIAVEFDFVERTQTVSAMNLTHPEQVLTTQIAYFSEDREDSPITLEKAKYSTIRLISVNAATGGARSMWDNVRLESVGPLDTITGFVEFQNYLGNPALRPVKVELVPNPDGEARTEWPIFLDEDGNYTINNVAAGHYDVYVSADGFLRKLSPNSPVTIPSEPGQAATADASLVNGDINSDNSITSADLNVPMSNLDKRGD